MTDQSEQLDTSLDTSTEVETPQKKRDGKLWNKMKRSLKKKKERIKSLKKRTSTAPFTMDTWKEFMFPTADEQKANLAQEMARTTELQTEEVKVTLSTEQATVATTATINRLTEEPVENDDIPAAQEYAEEAAPDEDLAEEEQDVEDLLKSLNEGLRGYAVFSILESKTEVNPSDFLFLAIAMVPCFLFFVAGLRPVINMLSFVYPAYHSFKALEARDKAQTIKKLSEDLLKAKESGDIDIEGMEEFEIGDALIRDHDTLKELIHWLRYWVVFGSFFVLEYMCDFVLSWVTNYENFKLAILLWCLIPRSDRSKAGSTVLYANVVAPSLAYYQEEMDEYNTKLSEVLNDIWEEVLGVLGASVGGQVSSMFSMAFGMIKSKAAASAGDHKKAD